MLEVYPNLFVGSMVDYETIVSSQTGWAIVHACKEPYHRRGWVTGCGAFLRAIPSVLLHEGETG